MLLGALARALLSSLTVVNEVGVCDAVDAFYGLGEVLANEKIEIVDGGDDIPKTKNKEFREVG